MINKKKYIFESFTKATFNSIHIAELKQIQGFLRRIGQT